MFKNFIRKFKYIISLIVGGYASYWLIANPLESYPIPIILYWLPDVIGWNGFFIVCGILVGLITFGLCLSLSGESQD